MMPRHSGKRDFQRRQPLREAGHTVVIVCEGEKTEPHYFNGIRMSLRLSTVQVVVVKASGTNPRRIVTDAVDRRAELIDDERWDEDQDSVWAVFDGDEHIVHNKRDWDEALNIARDKDINLAISNPCFEYWYLLHYQDHFANLDRNRARQYLKQHIANYEKADILYPDPLQRLTSSAIERAKRLEKNTLEKGLPPYNNPSTHVHKLVGMLLRLEH